MARSTRVIKQFGDLVTADHIVCRSLASHGLKGEQDCLMIYDKATNWLHCGPVKTKSSNNAYDQFLDFAGGEKIKMVYSDGSKELKSCCKKHRLRHEVSDPGIPQDNGLAESMVRVVVEGTRSALSRAGLPGTFWTLAGPHFAFARNIAIHDSGSSYDNRHGEGHFAGKIIPFGAGLFFQPIPSKAKGKDKPKFKEPEVPGVFLG